MMSTSTMDTIAIDLDQDEMGFEAWVAGQCAYLCAICDRMFFDSSEFWRHVKKDYMIGPDKYKERHGHPFHRRRFHDCKIPGCKSKVDWDRAKLMTHFFRRHKKITMKNYYESYVQRVTVKQEVIDSDVEAELVSWEPDSGIESPTYDRMPPPPRVNVRQEVRKDGRTATSPPAQRHTQQVANTPLNHGAKGKPRKILLGKRPLSQSSGPRPGPASKRRRAATPHPERDQASQPPGPMRSKNGANRRSSENLGGREDARDSERIPEASLADSSEVDTSSEEEEEFDTLEFVEEVGKATSTNEDIAKPAEENSAKLSVLECARRNKSKAKEELNKRQREQQLMMKQREEEEERRQKEAQEQQMREKEEMERQAEEAKKKAEKVKATAAPKISSTTTKPKPKPMPKSAGNKKKSTAPETQEWYDGCKYECPNCNKTYMTLDCAGSHMKGTHKIWDYQDKIITVYTSEHTCVLCDEKVVRNRDLIRRHVRASHKISFAEYEEKVKAFSASDKASENASEKVASPTKKKAANSKKKAGPQKAKNTLKIVGAASPITNRTIARSVDWSNDCTYACNFCDKEFGTPKNVKTHLRKLHKSANPGENYITVKETHYACKMCGAEVVRNREAIATHTNTRHGMSMPQYEKKYESGGSQEPQDRRDPTDDDDANRSPDFNGFGGDNTTEGENAEASEFSSVLNVTEATTDDSGFVGNTDGNADVSDESAEHDPLVPMVKQEQHMQMLAITDVVGSGEMAVHDIEMDLPDPEIIF